MMNTSAIGLLSQASQDPLIKVRYYAPTNLSVEVTGSGSNAPGNIVEIGVEGYSWSWLAPLWRRAKSQTRKVLSRYRT